jgi:hypothetical protein
VKSLYIINMKELMKSTMDYFATLIKKIVMTENMLYKRFEAMALNPKASLEWIDLLVRLNEYS